jgi:hypothetical protein
MGYRTIHFNLSTKWRCVVSFTPQSPNPQEKSLHFSLNRRLGEPRCRSGCMERRRASLPAVFLDLPTSSLIAAPNKLPLLNVKIISFRLKGLGLPLKKFCFPDKYGIAKTCELSCEISLIEIKDYFHCLRSHRHCVSKLPVFVLCCTKKSRLFGLLLCLKTLVHYRVKTKI